MPDTSQEKSFAVAAKRHFRDADFLRGDARLPAADHLYGFAAECATKSLLLRFTEVSMGPKDGEQKPSAKPWALHPEDSDRIIEFGHVNELIREVKLLAHGRAGAPLHAALEGDLRAFKKWHVKYRYSDGGYAQQETVERRRGAAHNILALHEQALLEGRIP